MQTVAVPYLVLTALVIVLIIEHMSEHGNERESVIEPLWIQIDNRTENFPAHKRLAVQKYMRRTIHDMGLLELRLFIVRGDFDVLIEQASKGYDRFMAKRAKRDK
jgi:hypothetical protein